MRVTSCQSLDAVEYLWRHKGKLVNISDWTRAIYGHVAPSLQKKTIRSISTFRTYAEERGFGLLVPVHEQHGNRSRVTHVLLADSDTNPKYISRDLMARKGREIGFKRSLHRAVSIVKDEKLLPMAQVEEIQSRNGRPLFISESDQRKMLAAAAEHIEKRKKPQFGKATRIKAS